MVARWQWKEVSSWQVGPYRLNHDGILTLGGVAIPLSPLQGRLLLCFVRHAGQLIERGQLMEEVWGHRRVSDVSLARAVHSLRQVLDRGPLGGRVISTSYGSGYVFSAPVLSLSQAADGGGKSTLSPPSLLALEYYHEARVASRHLDPLQLERSRALLQRSLQATPAFSEAALYLVSLHLDRCRWGLVDSLSVGAEVETLLHQVEQHHAPSEHLHALRAESSSLLHWQPAMVQHTYGSWLPQELSFGLPLLSWVRHLLACGQAEEGMELLGPKLDTCLPIGWYLAAQLLFQMGQAKAAMEMLTTQLRIDRSIQASQLFLAVLHAHMGDRSAALASLDLCQLKDTSFHGFQAGIAYALARVGEGSRAEPLLAKAASVQDAALTMISVWALAALAIGERDLAGVLFQRAVDQRCYQAPFLAQSPLLDVYGQEPCVQAFRERMGKAFERPTRPVRKSPKGETSASLPSSDGPQAEADPPS